ncbi:MAG TPA: glycosyltransferase [Candidatus Limnocylindria bacterium]|nr:glycosyltransferase [Candidatus Limnocylindria bacterium]
MAVEPIGQSRLMPADLSLHYLLSTFPLAQETFVTGEIRAMAELVAEVSVTGMVRSDELDLRPGGIPERVAVDWIPRPSSPAFWSGLAAGVARRRRSALRDWASMLHPAPSAGERLRWRRLAIGASAWAARRVPSDPARHHLHAHFAARGAVGAYMVSLMWGVPYSMTVHAFDIFRPNPRLRDLAGNASLIVAISDFDREELLRLVPDLDPARVSVIHVGVPVGDLAALGAMARQSADRSAEPLIVSAGRLVEKKGMEVLVAAVAQLARDGTAVRCEIVGEGPLRPRLERMIRSLGIGELVTLRGALPPDAARRRIAEADLFVLACVRASNGDMDGIPVALMEAMGAETPVISTRLSGIPELVSDREHGILAEPGDATSLAAALKETMANPEATRRRARAGARVVHERFDQVQNAGRLLAAILASRNGAGPR